VRLFQAPNFETPLATKSFFKADQVNMQWNKQGTACLVSTQTDVDQSGKSYYGESNLYYMSIIDGASIHVQLGL
jgi:translation initiation factor 2A